MKHVQALAWKNLDKPCILLDNAGIVGASLIKDASNDLLMHIIYKIDFIEQNTTWETNCI